MEENSRIPKTEGEIETIDMKKPAPVPEIPKVTTFRSQETAREEKQEEPAPAKEQGQEQKERRETERRRPLRRRRRMRKRGFPKRYLAYAAIVIIALIVIVSVRNAIHNRRISKMVNAKLWEKVSYDNEVFPAEVFKKENFKKIGQFMVYSDDTYASMPGIDVSSFNGNINWNKVAGSDIAFAFVRVGNRGYTEGGLYEDSNYKYYIEQALANGLDVGAYIFSQAVSEAEAREEARFLIERVKDYDINLPLVYDAEEVGTDSARTNGLSKQQFTINAQAFCEEVEKAGYTPAIYCNASYQIYHLDMTKFKDVITWYADFSDYPQSANHFEYWQYTPDGRINGISTDLAVDLNIRFIKRPPTE